MAQSKNELFVVSASLTDDGSPAYMRADHSWSAKLSDAATADAADIQPMVELALTHERQVCDPYSVKVRLDDGAPVPLTAREAIRATGPTTRVRRPDPAN